MKYLLILFILIKTTIYAQQEWSLENCINYAIQHNPNILAQKTSLKIDSINLQTYRLDRLPQIDFSLNQGYQLGDTYNVSTGVGQKQSSYTSFNLSAQMILFNGFYKKYQISHQKKMQQKDYYQYEDAKWQLKWDIINSYFQVLYEQENLSNIEFLITQQKEQIKILDKLHKQHYKPVEDILSAQIDLKNLELQKQQTQQQKDIYLQKLADLLYIPPHKLKLKSDLQTLQNITDTSNIQLDNLYHLKKLSQEIELLEAEKQMEKSKRLPKIFFNYSFGSNYYHILGREDLIYNQEIGNYEPNGLWEQFNNNRIQYLGIGLNIPIFDGLKIKNNIKELDYKKQIAQYNYQNEKQKTIGIFNQLLNEINIALEQYNIQKEIYKLTEKNYNIKKEKYLKNIIPYAEWQQTINNYHQSKTKVLQAKYTLFLKQEIFDRLYLNLLSRP